MTVKDMFPKKKNFYLMEQNNFKYVFISNNCWSIYALVILDTIVDYSRFDLSKVIFWVTFYYYDNSLYDFILDI